MTFRGAFHDKRVLVTGHTGFKGSWLSLWLHRLGAKVQGYALEPETDPSLFGLARIGECLQHEVGDLRDMDHLMAVFNRFQPEVVFHLAAQAIVRRSYQEPKETVDVNVGGTVNVLEAIRRTPSVQAAVMITSDKCYENRGWIWGYRENDPMGGHDIYSASKGAAELIITAFRRSFFPESSGRKLGLASVRAGNVIGGGDFGVDRIIPDAVRALRDRQRLRVRNPRSVRPWQHVLDPLAGYLTLAERLLESPQRHAGAWNFGPDLQEIVPVEALIDRFFKTMGAGEWEDVSAGNPGDLHEANFLWVATDKANLELHWRPIYSIPKAVDATARWYKRVILDGGDARQACFEDLGTFLDEARRQSAYWAS